jgi:hypothetical protein
MQRRKAAHLYMGIAGVGAGLFNITYRPESLPGFNRESTTNTANGWSAPRRTRRLPAACAPVKGLLQPALHKHHREGCHRGPNRQHRNDHLTMAVKKSLLIHSSVRPERKAILRSNRAVVVQNRQPIRSLFSGRTPSRNDHHFSN